ncbi:Lrp/AsnC family transcription regulator / TrkA domain protein (plasmid) [Natronomonas pharaonis DSM 2160]|uniref:Lrp/AsnC family transcription regulator / TrkA domain protein n=1 Tax=Natronomonas pharaonis (strain ATCC 35678 / DSM 2160 / CIP 103997 / JCM 8858 / NBRC 14720 / NCIMB 2260 / Gabara) TaxID=348780 RepID=Q3IM32_NATPD|nr:Lrp/AsnC family transcriptional regulator [Natronomonas pharaonis]CAI50833.1 Lrp/AsnC family transcription regulator / TrkA domain protein [Natronomonas pharaonis DSM 2160]
MSDTGSEHRLDQIDRRIIYALMGDARNTSAPDIAEHLSVSGATVRNRIARLEERGIIKDYQATIDFEQADGSLMNLYLCHAPFGEVEAVSRKLGTVPGVINVRELMGGRRNLHVLAVGRDTDDLRRIGREIEELDIEIEDEFLLQQELHFPYLPYGPEESRPGKPLADYMSLAGGAEVVELTVEESAPIVGCTLEEATQKNIIEEQTLVIAIERDDTVITPKGDTEIQPQDVVTVFSPGGAGELVAEGFRSPPDHEA